MRTVTSLVQQAILKARDLTVEVERALVEVTKLKIIQKRTIMVLGASYGKKKRLGSFRWTQLGYIRKFLRHMWESKRQLLSTSNKVAILLHLKNGLIINLNQTSPPLLK